jgi:hypothetical protein
MFCIVPVLQPAYLSCRVVSLRCHDDRQYMMTRLCQGGPNHAPAVVIFHKTDVTAAFVGVCVSCNQLLLFSDHRIPRGQVSYLHLSASMKLQPWMRPRSCQQQHRWLRETEVGHKFIVDGDRACTARAASCSEGPMTRGSIRLALLADLLLLFVSQVQDDVA